MTKRAGDYYDRRFIFEGVGLNSTWYSNLDLRQGVGTDNAVAATGVEIACAIAIPDNGTLVSNITFVTGGTAANGPTAGYAVLRSSSGAKLAQTADFTSTARAANTAYTVALATAQLCDAGLYYVGISFTVSTTVPTLRGITNSNAVLNGAILTNMPVLSQTHGSAVGGTAPATIATPTTVAQIPLFILS